jgi:hypothetical protein
MINANPAIRVGVMHSIRLDQPVVDPACLLEAIKSNMAMGMKLARQMNTQINELFLPFIFTFFCKKISVVCF